MIDLEQYFERFRRNVIGYNKTIQTPYGEKPLVYADWVASGRFYAPIERTITHTLGPLIGNTHTETNITGTSMTLAYEEAKQIIKRHVHAKPEEDILILTGSGMTGAVNKFIRILGWKIHERYRDDINLPLKERPVVFTSIMEHHSNDITWRESIAEVVYIPHDEHTLLPDLEAFEEVLEIYKDRKYKVASISACSNVTGIQTDYHAIAKIMHRHGGYCFVDFAASAPYVDMVMRPSNSEEKLDAIFFSPHKFVGGPGTSGILLFDRKLYHNTVPDNPGGGTVRWVDRWGDQSYWDTQKIEDIEAREDGGTPPFLQAIKASLCMLLKEEMDTSKIEAREKELLQIALPALKRNTKIQLLNGQIEERLGILSFFLTEHPSCYNLMVQLLNDRYGIQVRGGCACAGPYGHFLLNINQLRSKQIQGEIVEGNTANKPGWVRLSLHPLMTNMELYYILNAIESITNHFDDLKKDYIPVPSSTSWRHKDYQRKPQLALLTKEFFGIDSDSYVMSKV